MSARISAFVIWSLVAATAVFWLLRLTAHSPQAPTFAAAVGKSTVVRGDLNRLFGAPPTLVAAAEAIPQAPSRFKLLGVMAPRSKQEQSVPGSGIALIGVDGKTPKAFAVGASVESGLVLQSVGLRTASLGPAQGASSMLLELPALVPPTTGVLPPSGFAGSSMQSNAGALPQSGITGIPVPQARGPQAGSPIGAPPPGMPLPPGAVPSPPARLPANDNLRSQ